MEKNFSLLEHTADVKLRAVGKTKEEALEFLVRGFAEYQLLKGSHQVEKNANSKEIDLKISEFHLLPADLLNEIIFLQETHKEIYPKIANIKLDNKKLKAELEALPQERRRIDVKAATYNEIVFEEKDSQWVIEVVIDI